VLLWDRQQDRVIASQVCHAKSVLFARFRPGSPQLATGGLDYLVKLWHLPDLTLRYTLPGHSNSVFASAFTPDGRSLVTGSGNRFENVPGDVRIWDVETGHLRATLLGQTGPIAMSSDGAMLATVEEFTAVRLWRADPPR
jgi:WD40 repeat protein